MDMITKKRLLILDLRTIVELFGRESQHLLEIQRLLHVIDDEELCRELEAREEILKEIIAGLEDLYTFLAEFARFKPVIVVEQ